MIRTTISFVGAVIDATILTIVVATQLVLNDILGFGLEVTWGDRLDATIHDLIGLAIPLLILIGISFLVAFPVARYACRRLGGSKMLWYIAAGFLSIPAALMIARLIMGLTVFAAARTSLGMFLVACCGAAGGSLFVFLSGKPVTADV